MREKVILDACCGGREMWFNKHHPNALYIDIRNAGPGLISQRPNFSVVPDEIMNFKDLKYKDNSFRLVVWDPPHLIRLTPTAVMAKKYGKLFLTWEDDLRAGFSECWRVLKDYGVLIFKWNERDIPLNRILSLFHTQPLFGHTTGSKSRTHWLCFMKIPEEGL